MYSHEHPRVFIHITSEEAWNEATLSNDQEYKHDSLKTDRFIHASTFSASRKLSSNIDTQIYDSSQIVETLNKYYKDKNKITLLFIDKEKVNPRCVYEDVYTNYPPFPHIYGNLNVSAVILVEHISRNGIEWTQNMIPYHNNYGALIEMSQRSL